jgi:hypothetical protein
LANRSYLYSIDEVPGARPERIYSDATGIGQWRWDTPLVHKLLVSVRTRVCRSIIWEDAGNIALIGDYEQGVARLAAFLARIELPEARPLIDEALAFMAAPHNRRRYFLLEAGEVFMMGNGSPTWQNLELLDEIEHIDASLEAAIAGLRGETFEREPAPPPSSERAGFIERWFDAVRMAPPPPPPGWVDPSAVLESLGLGQWCNTLFFDYRTPTVD